MRQVDHRGSSKQERYRHLSPAAPSPHLGDHGRRSDEGCPGRRKPARELDHDAVAPLERNERARIEYDPSVRCHAVPRRRRRVKRRKMVAARRTSSRLGATSW